MAASSKPTAVHFTLIFFVMLSMFLGVFAYMFYGDFKEANAKLAEAQSQNDADKRAIATGLQQVADLKQVLGYDFAELGSSDDPNSVLGALAADFRNVAGLIAANPQSQTVREMLGALASQLASKAQSMQQAQESEKTALANYQTQTQQQAVAVATAQQEQKKSETELRDLQQRTQEQLQSLTQQVAQWQTDYRDVLGKFETLKAEMAQAQEDWAKQRKRLNDTIDFQKEQIAQLENISFEEPDGKIEYVDNNTRQVWINRGQLDYLRPQVTFSVYTQDHRGIARSAADVKAKIEVVEVRAHSARCKILEEDLARPIAPGDPIYTPLWHAGMVEKIAFVGIIDLDGDGVSDRDLLQELMDINHSLIKLQIMDDGSRVPAEGKLDVDTKFLVEGPIPDPTEFAGLDEKQRFIEDMMAERRKLHDEARDFGVRIISLNEFLTWVGYKNQQRVFRPGQEQPYNLNAGARSTAVDQVFQDRTSSGTNSALYSRERVGGSVPTSDTNRRYGGR